MSAPDSTLDRRIFAAYQQVKKARADGKYAAIVWWMTRVDTLLDERLGAADPIVEPHLAAQVKKPGWARSG
jgi:hypothetical protein